MTTCRSDLCPPGGIIEVPLLALHSLRHNAGNPQLAAQK